MTRYVIDPGVAWQFAEQRAVVSKHHQLLSPTLLRSQFLAMLFAAVQKNQLTRKEANQRLDYLRGLQIRLLGDRVLQSLAWDMALELGWSDTFVAEYLALTKLQADALVVSSAELGESARRLVPVADLQALLA